MIKFLRIILLTTVSFVSYTTIKPQNSSVTVRAADAPLMRITEYMYDGVNKEFVEFTNVGNVAIDITGWSFDDDSRVPGTVSLSTFGIVKPGESVILAESSVTEFRAAWGLCNAVKIIGNLTTNLGRNDEINLFDASGTLVDRLSFGDQNFPSTIRTQNRSGWVSAAGLGANNPSGWTLSSMADEEASFRSSGGDIGSPGKSARATVAYAACPEGRMRITEYMYDGANLEFMEFTNVGTTTVDMTGWSFDDDSRIPGTVSLGAFGIVQPGESVILAENNVPALRTAWKLCNGVKVIGGLSTNLGRNDEINLFDASGTLADRLSFGDQNFPSTIRTQNKSGWVSAAGLGTNTIAAWNLSGVGDEEKSFASTGGDIGSPGKSTRAIVSYDPCTLVAGAPVITMDVINTTNYLDRGVITSPASPYAISGTINEAADPASSMGINFNIEDDATPVGNLIVTVSSSNTSVVPAANLKLSGNGATRNLKITADSAGYSNINITVNDGTYNSSYILNYAASITASPSTKWPTGIADASAAIALDDDYMVIANDESNLLYVYNRNASGLPQKTFDFNSGNILSLTDGSTGNWKEVDIEAAVSSTTHTGRVYWLGSMSNSSSFNNKPNRDRIFATDINGTAAGTSFTNTGFYSGLRQQLIMWGDAHGYGFTSSAAEGKDSKLIDGFNAEGMVFAPDNATLYIGLRAPLVPLANRTKAVIAPVQNFETWFNNGSPSGNPAIGEPIELNLGGRGIRDMIRLSNGNYIIVAGSYDETNIPAIYSWTGDPHDAPFAQPSLNLAGLNAEAAMAVNDAGVLSIDRLQIVCDNGNNIFYNDGLAAKDLPMNNHKKFMSTIVRLSVESPLPVHFEYFTAQRNGANVQLNWKNGVSDDATYFNIMRSDNGTNFNLIGTISAYRNQSVYSFTDINAPLTRVYYRIQARDVLEQSLFSVIRLINQNGDNEPQVKIYPNPVSNGTLSLVTNMPGIKTVSVYNSAGILYKKFTLAETAREISTSNWPKGYYMLLIVTANGGTLTKKIAIQ